MKLVACLVLCACSDPPHCGPGKAPANELVATAGGTTWTYSGFMGGLNNDCRDATAPMGVISLTLVGRTADGTGLVGLCIERPDRLEHGPEPLGPDVAGTPVHIVDVGGTIGSCSYTIDKTAAVTGTLTQSGLCDNGADPAGFAFTVDAGTATIHTADGSCAPLAVTLAGTATFVPPP